MDLEEYFRNLARTVVAEIIGIPENERISELLERVSIAEGHRLEAAHNLDTFGDLLIEQKKQFKEQIAAYKQLVGVKSEKNNELAKKLEKSNEA